MNWKCMHGMPNRVFSIFARYICRGRLLQFFLTYSRPRPLEWWFWHYNTSIINNFNKINHQVGLFIFIMHAAGTWIEHVSVTFAEHLRNVCRTFANHLRENRTSAADPLQALRATRDVTFGPLWIGYSWRTRQLSCYFPFSYDNILYLPASLANLHCI
jgi:hypothetical protein